MWRVAVSMALACIALALSVLGASLSVSRDQQRHGDILKAACFSNQRNTQELRDLLIFFETRTLQNPKLARAQRVAITDFYTAALKRLPASVAC